MAKDKEFEHESIQDNQTIADYLKSLIEGFEKGQISLNGSSDQLDLFPNNLLNFTLKAKRKSDKNKLTLQFSWKTANSVNKPNSTISITSE